MFTVIVMFLNLDCFPITLKKKTPKMNPKMIPIFKGNFRSPNSVDPQTANPQTSLTSKRFWLPNGRCIFFL